MKTRIIPFDIEMAKKIQSGEVEGRVITFNNRYPVRILAFDLKNKKHSIVAALTWNAGEEIVEEYNELGKCSDYLEGSENINLYIELPEETPKQTTLGDYYEGNKVWVEYENHYILTEIIDKNQNDRVYVWNLTSTPKNLSFLSSAKAYKQKPEFKPFDKVLVRDCSKSGWQISFFSHIQDDWFITCNGHMYKECIPYEGNEHLVGTTNKY